MVSTAGTNERITATAAPTSSATSLELATTPLAAGSARRECRAVLGAWSVPTEVTDAVVLVVSELVTNAGRHAFPGCPSGEAPSSGELSGVERVRLTLRLLPGGVRVAVSDGNPLPPMRRNAGAWDEDGRGLMIVGALAESFHVEPIHRGGRLVGKTVSAVVPLRRGP